MPSLLDSMLFKTEPSPNAARDLGNQGSMTPDEIMERRKKLMQAGSASTPFPQFQGIATNLFGTNVQG